MDDDKGLCNGWKEVVDIWTRHVSSSSPTANKFKMSSGIFYNVESLD